MAKGLPDAKRDYRRAVAHFRCELDRHMRRRGRGSHPDRVLVAAAKMWQAEQRVRLLTPDTKGSPVRTRDQIPRDIPVRRPLPKRMTSVVSGGLPGSKRRK